MSVRKQNHIATEEKTEGRKIWKQRNMKNILINERRVMGIHENQNNQILIIIRVKNGTWHCLEISNINQLSTLNKAIFKQYIYLHWLCTNLWLPFKTLHRVVVTDYTHILLILTAVYKVMAGLCLDLRMNNGCFLIYFSFR
jgi:hypothetical protein